MSGSLLIEQDFQTVQRGTGRQRVAGDPVIPSTLWWTIQIKETAPTTHIFPEADAEEHRPPRWKSLNNRAVLRPAVWYVVVCRM